MNNRYRFSEPDQIGFDTLLSSDFVRHKDMIFLAHQFDASKVQDALATTDPGELQRTINHTHLLLYAPDLDMQRAWAAKLRAHWSERIAQLHPDLVTKVDLHDDGQDVIVTLWSSPR